MKGRYKTVIPVAIAAAAIGGYLIFSKPQEVTQPAKNNQVQEVDKTASENISAAQEAVFVDTPDIVISKEIQMFPYPIKMWWKKFKLNCLRTLKRET